MAGGLKTPSSTTTRRSYAAVTQTIKLTLDPVTLDAQGNVVSVFIDADDTPPRPPVGGYETSLEG